MTHPRNACGAAAGDHAGNRSRARNNPQRLFLVAAAPPREGRDRTKRARVRCRVAVERPAPCKALGTTNVAAAPDPRWSLDGSLVALRVLRDTLDR